MSLAAQLRWAYHDRFAVKYDFLWALKFDPNQPRDKEGQWTRTLAGAEHRLAALVGKISRVHVYNDPTSIRAAHVTADVLEEMHAKGYRMPDTVTVTLHGKKTITGEILHVPPSDRQIGEGTARWARHLTVVIPEALPDEANLDDAVMASFGSVDIFGRPDATGKGFVSRTMKDIIVHEMGHVQAGPRTDATNPDDYGYSTQQGLTRAMEQVSEYAGKNIDEFIAESFTKLYRGETLPPEAAKIYERANGPRVKA